LKGGGPIGADAFFIAKNKEGITSIVKKERGRDKIKRTGNEKVPKTVNGETVASQ
jgi:hypothetical protein